MKRVFIAVMALFATPAMAQQDAPDLCSDRPGLNTSPCTIAPHQLQLELGLGDWTLDRQGGQRQDSIAAGDILLRYGIGGGTEIRLGWTAYGHVRTRDRLTGAIDRAGGVGDMTIGLKQMLVEPASDGGGLALALLPQISLPTGSRDIGDGDWGASLILPASYTLGDGLSLALSPEIDAAVNESGSGRHLAFGTAVGMEIGLGEAVSLTPELHFLRDREPGHAVTESRAALSFAVQPVKATQFDIQAVAGLNHDTPDVQLSFGFTRAF